MAIIKYISVLLVFLSIISSCKEKISEEKPKEKMYEWQPQISAPDNYPAAYVNVGLSYENGGSAGASSVFTAISPSWGSPHGSFVSGKSLKPIPVKVSAHWMSVPEAVFYEGEFDLAKDSIQQVFEKKEFNPRFGDYDRANRIMVGVAPGGIVTVWVNGLRDQVEVGRFQARKSDYKPDRLEEKGYTMERLADELLDKEEKDFIKKFGIPFEAWKKRPKEYEYQIDILHPRHYPIASGGTWSRSIDGRSIAYKRSYGIYNNWEEVIGETNEHSKKRPLPMTLNTTWYSAAEDVLYQSKDQILPQKKLETLFSKPYEHPEKSGEMVNFNKIVVGMAPGGIIVVWVDGPGRHEEIARFKAKESKETLRSFINSRYDDNLSEEAFRKKILGEDQTYIKQHGIPYGSW